MWRWYCFDANRDIIARSSEVYFSYAEAGAAIMAAKVRIIEALAA
jgi:uncharacterized protein YegP (UPF0339 family)